MDFYKKKYLKYKDKYLKLKGGGDLLRFQQDGIIVNNILERRNNLDASGNDLLIDHHLHPRTNVWSRINFKSEYTTCLNVMWNGVNQHIYGTSLPVQNSIMYPAGFNSRSGAPPNSDMYNVLGYFMYGLGVSHLISLHACSLPETWEHARSHYEGSALTCFGNPTGSGKDKARASSQVNTWNTLKNIYQPNDNNVQVSEILIKDMRVGTIYQWVKINDLSFGDDKNTSQLYHCLAGFGRTGTVLLLKLMKYHITGHNGQPNCAVFNPSRDFLHNPFCFDGVTDSNAFSWALYYLMTENLTLYSHVDDGRPFNYSHNKIFNNGYEPLNSIDEVFNIDDDFHIMLFVSRINTILICLWLHLYTNDRLGGIRDRHENWMLCRLFRMPDFLSPISIDYDNIFNGGELVNMGYFFMDDDVDSPFYRHNITAIAASQSVPTLANMVIRTRVQWRRRYGIKFTFHD